MTDSLTTHFDLRSNFSSTCLDSVLSINNACAAPILRETHSKTHFSGFSNFS